MAKGIGGTEVFQAALGCAPEELPLGCVLGSGSLLRCIRTEDLAAYDLAERELEFGDFGPGRFGWLIRGVVAYAQPIPARGALGLWEWALPEQGV